MLFRVVVLPFHSKGSIAMQRARKMQVVSGMMDSDMFYRLLIFKRLTLR